MALGPQPAPGSHVYCPAIPQESSLAEEPTLFDGKYTILAKLREGGMGTIYKVHHNLLDEIRVIKFMRAAVTKDPDLHRRFLQEAKLVTRFKHPNIAAVYDFALDDDGTAYIVMEYVDGLNLNDATAALTPLSIAFVLEVTSQTLDALAYLHRKNVVHRDISPDNIMVVLEDDRVRVKLIDLGIAKSLDSPDELTKTGFFLGKLKYASPEQLGTLQGDERLDGRSDLYSLGVAMYELLTGQLPFGGGSAHAMITGHLVENPASFDKTDPEGRIPLDVRNLVMRSLEKNRTTRFASAEEFRESILRIQQQLRLGAAQIETQRIGEVINAAAATAAEGETATPSAQERMNRQFNLAETTPAPDVTPAGKTVAGTKVAPAHGTVAVDPGTVAVATGPAAGATVAVQDPLHPRRPAIARGWLVASGAAALVLVALGIAALRSDPPPPVTSGDVTATTATVPTSTSSTSPNTTTEEPLVTPIETTTTAVPASIPITPTTTAAVPPEDDPLRRAAAQARTRSTAARAAALAVEAEPQPAFRRASASLRDAESLLSRGRLDSAITKYNEASRLFASAEQLARAANERRVDPPPATTRETRPTPPIDVTTTRATVPEGRPADYDPRPADPRPSDPRPDPPAAPAEDAIRDTIAEYVSAQEDLDADRYVRTYPSADRDRIAAAFRSFRSQDLDLTISSVQVNGSRATVRAQESRVAVPRAGTVQRVNAERSFTLERRGGRWVIVAIR